MQLSRFLLCLVITMHLFFKQFKEKIFSLYITVLLIFDLVCCNILWAKQKHFVVVLMREYFRLPYLVFPLLIPKKTKIRKQFFKKTNLLMPDFLKPSPFYLFFCSISKKIEKSQSSEIWRKTNSLCSSFDIFHKAVENLNMKARFMSFLKVICRFPRRLCSHHLL